jgi:hypothetical protein
MECQYDATTVANLYREYIVCGKAWSHSVYVIYIGMPVNFVEINVTNARIPHHIPKATTLKYLCLFCAKEFHLHCNCTFITSGLCLWQFLFRILFHKINIQMLFLLFCLLYSMVCIGDLILSKDTLKWILQTQISWRMSCNNCFVWWFTFDRMCSGSVWS